VSRSTQNSGRWAVPLTYGLLAIAAIFVAAMLRGPQYAEVAADPLDYIQIKNLPPGEVRFFAYPDNAGDKIRFLLARDSAGRTKAAFDACQRCYIHNKGYARSHGTLICRYCGNEYRLESMESGIAYCAPVTLPIQVSGQTVSVRAVDLEQGRPLFQ
jgi:uncharacterized membrane protein